MSKAKLPQRIKQENGSERVMLLEPIQSGEERIEFLDIQKPKAKHLRRMKLDNLSMDDMINLAGKLALQPPHVMDELCIDDLNAVLGAMNDFLGGLAPTGETS